MYQCERIICMNCMCVWWFSLDCRCVYRNVVLGLSLIFQLYLYNRVFYTLYAALIYTHTHARTRWHKYKHTCMGVRAPVSAYCVCVCVCAHPLCVNQCATWIKHFFMYIWRGNFFIVVAIAIFRWHLRQCTDNCACVGVCLSVRFIRRRPTFVVSTSNWTLCFSPFYQIICFHML